MLAVLGEVLPLAIGVAISPTPVIAVTVLLLSERGRATSVAFVLGWIGGVAAACLAFSWLSGLVPTIDRSNGGPLLGVLEILLGIALVVLSISRWVRAADRAGTTDSPGWLRAVDKLKPWQGLAIGIAYAAFRPKNLVLSIAAGLVIGSAELSPTGLVITIGTFTGLGSLTIAAPLVLYHSGVRGSRELLERLRRRLLDSVGTITGTVMLVLGVLLIGMGLAQL